MGYQTQITRLHLNFPLSDKKRYISENSHPTRYPQQLESIFHQPHSLSTRWIDESDDGEYPRLNRANNPNIFRNIKYGSVPII